MASLRRLARLIGCDEKAVRKAEKAGVFGSTLRRGDDGTVLFLDLDGAVDRWEKSGRRLRGSASSGRQEPAAAAPAPVLAPPEATEPAGADVGGDREDDDALPPLPPNAPFSLVDAQIATMRERQRKLRLENDVREGSLVEVERASREAFEFARALRENVLNVPARLAAELAAETDSTRVHLRLDGALREALEATATALDGAAALEVTKG
jgi:hypothetical protein